MKKLISALIFIFVLSGMLLLDSCSKSDDPAPVALTANAGADQTAAPFTTVTLDGSASTGEGNINYQWTYNGGNSISVNIVNQSEKVASFIPSQNGIYTFTLRITRDSQFSEDQVTVTVSGAVTLSGTLSENLILKDIEPDPTKADYKITEDLKVPSGKTITTEDKSGEIRIEVSENAGIMIDGGSLSHSPSMRLTFTSASGWKGFVLASGALNLTQGSKIENAAKTVFSSAQTEPAAITAYTNGTLNLTGISFTGSTGYDLLMPDFRSGSTTIESNSFSAAKPIKTTIAMLGKISFNSYATPYDYILLTTPGAGTTVTAGSITGFVFQTNTKYYIDDDFTAGSLININLGASIFMKAGAGILVSGSSASITVTGGAATIDGLNSAAWKGIAVGGGAQFSVSNLIIKNAGSDVFNTGSFNSLQKAAIYYAGINSGSLTNSQIINSKGYGVYIDGPSNVYLSVSGTTFTNPASPAIRGLVSVIDQMIVNPANTYTMPAGVAAVEVLAFNPNTYQPKSTWQALGSGNFYLITGNIFAGTSWTLAPGVNLKFKAGKSLDVQSGTFTAIGTAQNPITFDSEAGTVGTWPGIVIESNYKLEFCQIKNGGESLLFKGGVTPATEKANIVFNNITNAANTFKNNTISGSSGYGILVEAGKQNPDAANVANNNTFTSNTSGNIIVK